MLNKKSLDAADGLLVEAVDLFERLHDEIIGFVNDGGFEGVEVDLGGCFAVVPHYFTDYA